MKVKFYLFMLLLCSMAVVAPPEMYAQSAQTVNESGGAGLNDGLKFVVNTNGALAVYRDDRAQYYPGNAWPTGANSGVTLNFRFSEGGNYSQSGSSSTGSMAVCSTTPVQRNGNTYTTSISGYIVSTLSSDRFFVTLNVTYTHPNNYFIVDYVIRSPRVMQKPNQTVHMYLSHDAMILGCDASYNYRSQNSTGEFVGDYRPASCPTCPGPGNLTSQGKFKNPSSHGFKVKGGFRSYYAAHYSSRNNIDNTLKLSNTINTTGMCDDGIAVEFTAGPFTQPNQTIVRSVAHCYGNEKTEFDNLVINIPPAPAPSDQVTVEFAQDEYTETEGDHVAQNVKVKVSGGVLGSSQVCSFTVSSGTARENTEYTYVKGLTIPAGDYRTPKEIVLNNITIKDNSVCEDDKYMTVRIDAPSNCNDVLVLGQKNAAKVIIADNEPRPTITTTLQDTMIFNTGETVPAINLASDVQGAVISWTNSNASIGLATSGTGNIPSFTATNNGAQPITACITVQAAKGCAGAEKKFYIIVNSKFNITYDYNGGNAPATANPTTYLVSQLPLSITNEPVRIGYTFAGWTCPALGITTPSKPFVIPTGSAQHLQLVADWGSGADNYNITFSSPTGIVNPNTDRTYTYEDNVSIADPTIPGYIFKGWTITYDEPASPHVSSTINVSWQPHTVYGGLQFAVTMPSSSDTTNWSPISYRISYNYDGGTAPTTANPTSYNIQTPDIHLNAPTRNGYAFAGWTITSSESAVTFLPLTQIIPTGSYGNLTCKANWTENGYTISYNLNGATHPQTPTTYSFTDRVSIENPTLNGYTFKGWVITNSEPTSPTITPTKNVVFGPSTVFGNLTFATPAPPANGGGNESWEQITYNITYNLNGGNHGSSHPSNYKVTDNVSISVPTKTGYTFGGWTITNDEVASPLPTSGNPTTFGPANGVYGNLTFSANWSTDAYAITYNAGAADASFTNPINPGTYDIVTPISLTDNGAKRNGYTFNGWTITSDAAGVTVPDGMTIPQGTHGNLVCTAKWTINGYNISFNVPASVTNPNSNRSYTYEDDVTIANPSAPGYTFKGWTIVNDSVSSPAIPADNMAWEKHTVFGNISVSANDPATDDAGVNWDIITYNIEYNLNGGTPPVNPNPTNFNIKSDITLNPPTRAAYTFAGWTITSDEPAVSFSNPTNTIPAGSYGKLTCTANWTVKGYNITYDVASTINNPSTNPTTYNYEQAVTIANPTITGWTFDGWTITNDEPQSPIITPTKNVTWQPATIFGNLTFKATDPNVDTTNWTKNKYAVIYDINGGYGIPTIDANSPYEWGTTVTVLGKATSMARNNATYIGWSVSPKPLVTTQVQEDAISMMQAGDTFIMQIGDTTFYAVWAIDENGPEGTPDDIPDYKQMKVSYKQASAVTPSSGTLPPDVLFNPNTTANVAGNTGNLKATNKILIGWSQTDRPSVSAAGPAPSGIYGFGAPINIQENPIDLYAAWADDANGNGIPDYTETNNTTNQANIIPTSQPSGNTSSRTSSRTRTRSLELGNIIDLRSYTADDAYSGIWEDWDAKLDTFVIDWRDSSYVRMFTEYCTGGLRIPIDTLAGGVNAGWTYSYDPWDYDIDNDMYLKWEIESALADSVHEIVKHYNGEVGADSKYNPLRSPYLVDSVFLNDGDQVIYDYNYNSLGELKHWPYYLDDLTSDVGLGWLDINVVFDSTRITSEELNGSKVVLIYNYYDNTVSGLRYQPITSPKQVTIQHLYRSFELTDTVISQFVLGNRLPELERAAKTGVGIIKYGSPNLKRSINGGVWMPYNAPLTDMELASIGEGVDIRLRDPGDPCGGKVVHFSGYATPTTQRYVEIHTFEGVGKTSPLADMKHYVEGHQDFTFAVSFTDKPLKVVAEGFYSGKKVELVGDSISANTYEYTIRQVTEPMDIRFYPDTESGTSNEQIGNANVWTYGNWVYIQTAEATTARIYNLNGSLLKRMELNPGVSKEKMERGVYIIEMSDGSHYKVIVK